MSLLRGCVHVCGSQDCDYCELLSTKENSSQDRLPPETELYAGYDPGGIRDPAALVVIEKCKTANPPESEMGYKHRTAFRVVKTLTYTASHTDSWKTEGKTDNPYTRFTLEVSDLHKSLHFKRVLVDSTGLGAPIVELCKEIGLPTAEMKFTASTKEEILFNLKVLMEKRQITLPPDENDLLSSLNCIEAERTRTGGYSFDHPSGTHDDLAYALALAVWTAGKGDAKVIIMKQDHGRVKDPAIRSWRESAGSSEANF